MYSVHFPFNLTCDTCSQGTSYLVGSDTLLVLGFINLAFVVHKKTAVTDSLTAAFPLLPGCYKGKQCRGAPDPGGTRPAGSPAQTAAGFCPSRLTAGTAGTHQPGGPRWSAGQVSWAEGGVQDSKARIQASGIWNLKLQPIRPWQSDELAGRKWMEKERGRGIHFTQP